MDALPLDPAALGPFLVAVALVELTPGPNMSYLAVVAAARGRRAGLAVVLGVTAGLTVYMLAAAAGAAQAMLRLPGLYEGLRWAGVLYLLWLAWEAWRGERETSPGEARRGERAVGGLIWRGFLANVLNPKAAVFYVALLPGFVRTERGDVLAQSLLLGGVHLAVSVVVHVAAVLGASGASGIARARAGGNRVRRAFALAIAATALWLAWQTR